jgi:acetyl esterase/lipase
MTPAAVVKNAKVDPPRVDVRPLTVQSERGPLPARLYRAAWAGARRPTLIVYFHGGCFIGGSLDDADAFLRQLAARNPQQAILAARYTLATERPFPAALEDAFAVLQWAGRNKVRLGWNGARLMVAGIDAGANLAAAARICLDRRGPALAGQILLMPMLDGAVSTRSMRENALSGRLAGAAELCVAGYRCYVPYPGKRRHPYESPLHSSRLENLPPALFLSSQDDPLRDEGEQYGMNLIARGVRTTVRRVPTADGDPWCFRHKSICASAVDAEIAAFIDSGAKAAITAHARNG